MNFEPRFLGSLLEQAKYFYKAAEDSPTRSQPLLYYYSFLNSAKILINVDKRYGKNGFIYMHGVKENNNGRFSLSDIEIAMAKTTIKNVAAELADTLDNVQYKQATKIRIKDLLLHCVGIHRTYCELYNQRENFTKLGHIELRKTGKKIAG